MSTTEHQEQSVVVVAEPWATASIVVADAPYDDNESAVANEVLRLQRELARLDGEAGILDADDRDLVVLKSAVDEAVERSAAADKDCNDVSAARRDEWSVAFGTTENDDVGALESALEETEFAVAGSVLSHVWLQIVGEHFNQLVDGRLEQPRQHLADAVNEVHTLATSHAVLASEYATLTHNSAANKQHLLLETSNFLDRLRAETLREMERLQTLRARHVPKLQEQAFHLRRGSHKKHSVVELRPTDQALDRRREKAKLAQLGELVSDTAPTVTALEEEVKALEKQLVRMQNKVVHSTADLEKQVAKAKELADEATWELESVLVEQEQARSLRGDMLAVAARARRIKATATN